MIRAMALLFFSLAALRAAGAQETPIAVEPADLMKRDDLVGKLVSVDDRIRFFQNHPRVGYDELYLRRTPVPVRLPESLRPSTPPRNPAAIVRGRLTRDGTRLYLDAEAVELQPADLERLDKAVAALPARDFERRREWSRWAAARAKDFGDTPLAARAKAVEAEALRIEADDRRGTVDAPREWLTLARQGRKQGVAEPAPSALAHRAFRAMLASAARPADLEALRADVEELFPSAATDAAGAGSIAGALAERYEQDPAAAYRAASPEERKGLDRRLWADVVQRLLEARVAGDVRSALQAVDDATRLVPERPALAAKLVEQARRIARERMDGLRMADVKTIGELLRERANDPAAELAFYRDWLQHRRDRLGDADAEGPIALAADYEALLNDAESARQLLERARKIAPDSELVVEAFKLRGYRREGDEWVKDAPAVAAGTDAPPPSDEGQGLRGKTPAEVRAALGVGPDGRSVVATRGRTVLQWTFDGPRQRRYVNFLHLPGSASPRVTSDFFLPR
ncbi:hypothetical protein [Paludisphaera sp.]|uniref:hypothetical protein n=1 Tax=Paludisphaera sp. TaxID=2017432 RepID=UPI00301C159C